MSDPRELDSARLRRDLSLALRRRLTVYAGVGATALTASFALIAATTAPGKATALPAPAQTLDPTTTSAPVVLLPDPVPGSAPTATPRPLQPPAQTPRPSQQPPGVVSGGS